MSDSVLKLRRELEPILARYDAWELPLRRYRALNYRRLNSGGYTWEAYESGLAQLEEELAAVHDPRHDLHALFERLCQRSLADADARIALRAFVAEQRKVGQLLWRYANRLTRSIERVDDEPKVTLALAAVSMENCAANYRDTLMTLADLYVAAEAASIDPRPLFAAASDWSTDALTTGGCESLAAMMRGFHASSVLDERRGMDRPYGGPA